MNNIKDIVEGIQSIGGDGWEAIKNIGKFLNYLMHPSLIFAGLWHYTVIYSLWVCMFVALVSVVLYALGYKKLAKYAPTSVIVYTLIKAISSAF